MKQFGPSRVNWEVSASNSYEHDSAGNPKADFSWIGASLSCGYDPTAQTNPNVPHFRQQLRRAQFSASGG